MGNLAQLTSFISFLSSRRMLDAYTISMRKNLGGTRTMHEVLKNELTKNFVSRSIKGFLVTNITTKISDAMWIELDREWREVVGK